MIQYARASNSYRFVLWHLTGGFALAARWAGIETVQFVEIDPFCQKVLHKNFKGVPIHDDIKTFTYAETIHVERCETGQGEKQPGGSNERYDKYSYARPFLLTGGFPCQPFSCAGKRRGKEDDRYLWPEMLRVISEAKPRWVIGENVAGFINMGLDDCISDLEGEGYEVQAFIIPACAKNAPHRRDRVWICAHSVNGADRTVGGQIREAEGIQGERGKALGSRLFTETDSHALDTYKQGLQGGEPRQPLRLSGQFDRGWCDKESGWQENWLEVATRLCRVDDGLPRGVDRVNRLKALGNAIVPQIAFEIMKAIIEVEAQYDLCTETEPAEV